MLRLVSAGSIPDGTPLTLRPTTEVTSEVRAAIEAWVNQDPRRGRARWYNDRRQPLAWEYDGGRYRPTEIVRRILADASGVQRSARGPAWWVLEDDRDLPMVAACRNAALSTGPSCTKYWRPFPPAIGQPMESWPRSSGPDWLVTVKHAAWLLIVKGHQPTLYHQLRRLPWREVPVADHTRDRGHGRVELRRLQVTTMAGLDFPHATQAIRVTRRVRSLRSRRNIAAALRRNARDATRLLPLLGITSP